MFGNFNLNAGLSQLQDLGGRFQKIREDLEQNIESSLRTNIAPSASGDEADGSGAAVDGTVAFGGVLRLSMASLSDMPALAASVLSTPLRYQSLFAALSFFCQVHFVIAQMLLRSAEWEGYSLTTPATPAQPGSEKASPAMLKGCRHTLCIPTWPHILLL